MNSTTYAKRTQYKPIDFFFRGVVDVKAKKKKMAFVDAFQILNDRYLGRMSVCNYFAIAENSVRINELNIIALDELKNYHLVMRENFLIPENLLYSLPISTRFLENERDFEILVSAIKDNKYKKNNLILTFYGVTLVRLDADGKKRYNYLRRLGFKTCVTAFGEDFNSLDVFSLYNFDYLRCEAQYFEATPNKKKVLQMLVRFCGANKITLVMEGVDTPGQLARFKRDGVKLVTGRAVAKLTRFVNNEYLYLSDPVGEKRDQYMAKLQKELDEKAKEELKELEALRKEAIERAKAEGADGVMPISARPELAKSPYQVRLEQQRNAARKVVIDLIDDDDEQSRPQAELIVQQPEQDANMADMMSKMRFEGDVQSALALSFAYENKSELGMEKSSDDGLDLHRRKDVEGHPYVTEEESGVSAPERPTAPKEEPKPQPKKKKKTIRADRDAEAKLYSEFRRGDKLGGLDSLGMAGIGVTMHIESDDEPELVGHINEKGQWVDEDGNVYNGYFDAEGNWTEYEQFDSQKEGHYNENAQWVDADGNVYDGYFDEQGRWIDYTYTDKNGEVVDNGYFDDKIGKWVPFGYFDADGSYHKL